MPFSIPNDAYFPLIKLTPNVLGEKFFQYSLATKYAEFVYIAPILEFVFHISLKPCAIWERQFT